MRIIANHRENLGFFQIFIAMDGGDAIFTRGDSSHEFDDEAHFSV